MSKPTKESDPKHADIKKESGSIAKLRHKVEGQIEKSTLETKKHLEEARQALHNMLSAHQAERASLKNKIIDRNPHDPMILRLRNILKTG